MPAESEQEPEADVGVAGVDADRTGRGQEHRIGIQPTSRVDTQLLARLAPGRDRGVLVRLDVPTRRQPKSRVQMLAEQNTATVRVDRHDVGDQVPVRDVRLHPPEHVIGPLQPTQRHGDVVGFVLVTRREVGYRLSHCFDRWTHMPRLPRRRADLSAHSRRRAAAGTAHTPARPLGASPSKYRPCQLTRKHRRVCMYSPWAMPEYDRVA